MFVILLTSGEGNVALNVLFSKIACCIHYGITPEAAYRSSNGRYHMNVEQFCLVNKSWCGKSLKKHIEP